MSGLICLFQLIQIEKMVSGMHKENIRSIQVSQQILNETEKQTWQILDIINEEKQGNNAKIFINEPLYSSCLNLISENITLDEESKIFDTLKVHYQLFQKQSLLIDSLFSTENIEKRAYWFNTYYRPIFVSFTQTAHNLSRVNQQTISQNSHKLETNFYRMIIPLIVAVAVGFLLIMLFNYFINLYFINPVLNIIKGIKSYSESKTPYNVKVETQDEIETLNKEIKSLISSTRQSDKPIGIFDFNKKT